ncbi:MAG: polyphosphate:AMP phosphotransferase [Rhodospirillales bacterium]|nr:polyphosphate:AMP phosphotransferase [Rhodospirillales bacterium]
MFEAAELGHRIDKKTYKAEQPALREALLKAQFKLAESRAFPVIILIGGVDGTGKGPTVNTLNEWMDPRLIETNGMGAATDEEDERPYMWRFWRALPPRGKIGIFFGSWYTRPIIDRVCDKSDDGDLERQLDEIIRFETMLAAEGALIMKFWFHLSKTSQKRRLKTLEKDRHNRWRVTDKDWERLRMYDAFRSVSELALRRTNRGHAPWIVVEGLDAFYRNITVGRTLLAALNDRLEGEPPKFGLAAPPPIPSADGREVLDSVDLTASIPKKDYEKRLIELRGRLNLLSRNKHFRKRALVAVFEGHDAAGKGGSIRRVTAALDARFCRVVRIAAPTEEERLHPYLWRFWRHIPRHGHMTIFDRSWYGRVLVERVEGFAAEYDWMRAYGEINDFEETLANHGIIVAKFWLTIDRDEQNRRFEERRTTGYKRYKLTDEDLRNRARWDDYYHAIGDMVEQTSTSVAPWTLVAANDKRHARITVLETLCQRLEHAFDR